MISLRKHIDSYRIHGSRETSPSPPAGLAGSCLAALSAILKAIGECGQRAVPGLAGPASHALWGKLAEISLQFTPSATAEGFTKATAQVQKELSAWADSALRHHDENEREIREIIGVVSRAAETIGRKDEKYSREIGDLSGKMRSIADQKDLALIRRGIIENATLLKSCVEKMAEDGKASTKQLTAEIEEYRTKLAASEKSAELDPLTQLANRRVFERKLDSKIGGSEVFSLILLDLNDFKGVNDKYGHIAGDALLRQFSVELAGQFSPADVVCRWGGDEFAVITPGGIREAADRVERIRRWVLGEYKLNTGAQIVKVVADASIGAVEWDRIETGVELMARADQGLYQGKPNRPAARMLQSA